MKDKNEFKRIESKIEIQTFLDRLKYAIDSESGIINFTKERQIDNKRDKRFTNKFTVAKLFPDEDIVEVK